MKSKKSWFIAIGVVIIAVSATVYFVNRGPSTEEKEAAEQAKVEATEAAEALEEAEETYTACEGTLGEVADELTVLSDKMDVGLNFDEYDAAVAKVLKAKGVILPGELPEDCAEVVERPINKAISNYGLAVSIWNDCIYDIGCPSDSIDPELEALWFKASVLVEEMNEGRAALRDATEDGELELEDAEEQVTETEEALS